MSDSSINLMSDSRSDIFYVVSMGESLYLHLHPLAHDRMVPEMISLFDDYKSEVVFGDSVTPRFFIYFILIGF